jgi:hypothetical protein
MAKEYSKRSFRSQNVSRLVSRVVKPIMRNRGFYDVDIISDWEHIVGPEWAKQTCPQKLNFNRHSRQSGTLHILVTPGAGVLIQHIEAQIIDRVNTYFGFEAVNRLKLIHGHVVTKPSSTEKRKDQTVPLPEVPGIDDPSLAEALQRLGQSIQQRGN